jgi:ubiquinone/menaquinone biosynthesis C-methylase UbiE
MGTYSEQMLLEQAIHHLVVQTRRGLLPESVNPSQIRHVLDVHCQSGVWAIDLARSYPYIQVTALDSDDDLIELARRHADIGNLKQVRFYESLPGRPFPLADRCCDLVYLFLLYPILPPIEWFLFLRECMRVMRDGASINVLSLAWGPGSGEAYERILLLMEQLLQMSGYAFAVQSGSLSPGVFLSQWLKETGFANVTYTLLPINLGGWHNELGRNCCQLLVRALRTARPLLLWHGLISEAAFEDLLAQQLREIDELDFCATAVLISTLAMKKSA